MGNGGGMGGASEEWAVVWLEEEAKLKKAEQEEEYGAGREDKDVC